MRSFVGHAFLASLSLILNLADAVALFPTCADSCYYQALTSYGCNEYDTACYCRNPAATEYVQCVQNVCDQADLNDFLQWGQVECAAVGVTFSVPSVTAEVQSAVATGGSGTQPTGFAGNSIGASAASGSSPSASNNHDGLSVGAKVGIGVGAGLGFILIAGLLSFLFYRERQKRKALSQQQHTIPQQQQRQEPPVQIPNMQQQISSPPMSPLSYQGGGQNPQTSTTATGSTLVSTLGTPRHGPVSTKVLGHTLKVSSVKPSSQTVQEYELTGDRPRDHDVEIGISRNHEPYGPS